MGVSIQFVKKAFDIVDRVPKYVLNNVNLEIQTGEFVCLLGKSGCGKSTLLNLLAGYLKPDIGSITVNGKKVDGPSSERGVVFQQNALFPWYTVRENIAFGPNVQDRKDVKKITSEYINMVGLNDYADAYPSQLSGGMAQRVGIARALANDPDVLLMDEPLGALDALTRDNMRKEIIRLWQMTRKTVIFVTHSVPEAVYLADRVVMLKKGHIVIDQKIDLERPRHIRSNAFEKYVDIFAAGLTENGEEVIAE